MSDILTTEPAAPPVATTETQTQSDSAGQRQAGRQVLWIIVTVLVMLVGALIVSTLIRLRRDHEVQAAAAKAASANPRVAVAAARLQEASASRVLPGSALPLLEASMFARVTGYVRSRRVDIGDRVTEGQLLAVIDAPDIDDQLNEAKANLEQARATLTLNEANAKLAETTLTRSLTVQKENKGAVAQQIIDDQRANLGVTMASVEAARASIKVNQAAVQRFTDLQQFEKIVAPFPGVITARNIDPGDLVMANSTARELFHLMRTDVLRVFVNVPQVFSTGIRVGQSASIYRRENPRKLYPGKVTRTADALDPGTRTLLTEVQVPNANNELRPGMYLQVKFSFDRDLPAVVIPAAALTIRTGGPRVAVLDNQHRVQYRQVQLGRDFGAEIEVIDGLTAGETVVVHPGDDLPPGTIVDPVAQEPK